jgi:dipeptidyl aminopeptidase/acylaminoacyl peptidase
MVNLRLADVSQDGKWIAATASTTRGRIGIDNSRYGDPTYISPSLLDVWVINGETLQKRKVFGEQMQVRGLKWSPNGNRLALFVLKDDRYAPMIWEREAGELRSVPLPKGKLVANNAQFHWSPEGDRLVFSVHTEEWLQMATERFQKQVQGSIVVLSSKEPFLAWEEIRRLPQLQSVMVHDLRSQETRELLPEKRINSYTMTRDGSRFRYAEDITKKTDYDIIFGRESKIQLYSIADGQTREIIKSTKGLRIIWSREGGHYAYSKKGDIFFASTEDDAPRQLTGEKKPAGGEGKPEVPEPDETADEDKEKPKKESFTAVRLSADGSQLIASSKKGLWLLDTDTAAKEIFLEIDSEDPEAPRYQVVDWDPKGEVIYLSYSARTKYERGLVRYHCRNKELEGLIKDARIYSGFRLSEDGSTFVFSRAASNRPSDLYIADASFTRVRTLMEGNPQLAGKKFGRAELIAYRDADGKKLHGVLYYPVQYQPGKKYPTVFYVYERFFDDRFSSFISILNSNGYAVMQPSVNFETGYPGEAWIKGVTSAANRLIEMGVADPDRLGVQGTSYGGYATNLLIAQTDRFKAAINVSGKVNMVSFYTDSPRLGVRNIHAPEKSQDRIGATLWEQPHKYIQHSAIMFADRIKTPLLLITGEQDGNVPARQAMEMYYALRRLGKDVTWVQYTHGGHGMD